LYADVIYVLFCDLALCSLIQSQKGWSDSSRANAEKKKMDNT
jgi:hypothetical protein